MDPLPAIGLAVLAGLVLVWYIWRSRAGSGWKTCLVVLYFVWAFLLFGAEKYYLAWKAFGGVIVVTMLLWWHDRMSR